MSSLDQKLVHEQIRHYICNDILKDANYALDDDQPLLSGGLIDSFYFIQIALFIEQTFSVIIPDEQLTVENMDSLNKIVQQVMHCANEPDTV